MGDKETRQWAEFIVEVALQKRDARPLVDMAIRAGVDLDTLQRHVNLTLDVLHAHLNATAIPPSDDDRLLSIDDLAILKNLGIDSE